MDDKGLLALITALSERISIASARIDTLNERIDILKQEIVQSRKP